MTSCPSWKYRVEIRRCLGKWFWNLRSYCCLVWLSVEYKFLRLFFTLQNMENRETNCCEWIWWLSSHIALVGTRISNLQSSFILCTMHIGQNPEETCWSYENKARLEPKFRGLSRMFTKNHKWCDTKGSWLYIGRGNTIFQPWIWREKLNRSADSCNPEHWNLTAKRIHKQQRRVFRQNQGLFTVPPCHDFEQVW